MSKSIQKRKSDILGGKVNIGENNKDYAKFQKNIEKLKLPEEEIISVKTSSGTKTDIVLRRDGYTDEGLAMVLTDDKSTQDQRDSYLANYMFQRGKESASFLAELYLSKGKLTRESQAFKSQMKFDFEVFTDFFVKLLYSMSNAINNPEVSQKNNRAELILDQLSELLTERATTLTKRYESLTEERLKAKGFGIYIDRLGRPYDTRNSEIVDVVKRDVETTKEDLTNKDNGKTTE